MIRYLENHETKYYYKNLGGKGVNSESGLEAMNCIIFSNYSAY